MKVVSIADRFLDEEKINQKNVSSLINSTFVKGGKNFDKKLPLLNDDVENGIAQGRDRDNLLSRRSENMKGDSG